MKVALREQDLSDDYLRFAAQIGCDGLDIHEQKHIPGFAERGYADVGGVRALLDRLRRWGLAVYRVRPPTPRKFLLGQPGGDAELDDLCRTMEALGKAGVPFLSAPTHLFANPGYRGYHKARQRGGYTMTAFDAAAMHRASTQELPDEHRRSSEGAPREQSVDVMANYERSVRMYERLVPIAEAYDIRLIVHPGDPPLPGAEFSPLRWSDILDAVPSTHSGLLYCVGTRLESGVNVVDDIRAFGRRGKLFHVHFRHVRGAIPTHGGYQEVALGDGDQNMFEVLRALRAAGYDGALQVDHLPHYSADDARQAQASAYAVGYVRALLAALEVAP
jgi:mannonate dehydratase